MGGDAESTQFDYTPLDPNATYVLPDEDCPGAQSIGEDVNASMEAEELASTPDGECVEPSETVDAFVDLGVCETLPACPSTEYDDVYYEVQVIGVTADGEWATFNGGSLPTTFRGKVYRRMTLEETLGFQRDHASHYQSVCARNGEAYVIGELAKRPVADSTALQPMFHLTQTEATTIFAWLIGNLELDKEVGNGGFDPTAVDNPSTLTNEQIEIYWSKKERIGAILESLAKLKQVLEAKNSGGATKVSKLNPRGLPTDISADRLNVIIAQLEKIRDEGTAFSWRGFLETNLHGGSSAFWFVVPAAIIGYILGRRGGGGGHGGGGDVDPKLIVELAAAMAAKMAEAQQGGGASTPEAQRQMFQEVVKLTLAKMVVDQHVQRTIQIDMTTIGLGVLTLVLAAGTVALVLCPFDGPAGDVVAGSAALRSGTAFMGRLGLAGAGAAAATAVTPSDNTSAHIHRGPYR